MRLIHNVEHLPKGYINCYGVELTAAEVEEYNRITDNINDWQSAGYTARESDLNSRHRIISRMKRG